MNKLRGVVTDIESVGPAAQYDATCKRILANKYVLANILKLSTSEFRECDIKDIAEKYIEAVPEAGTIGVDVDCSNVGINDNIIGASNEDATRTEGRISYDVRFDALAPDKSEKISLIVNVEAQNDFKPQYPLIKRAIYYASRLISAQKGKYWSHSEYDKIRKVYTIWLCMNPPKEDEGFINLFELTEILMHGSKRFPAQDFDLINIVMIGLSQKPTDNAILNMLSTVFSTISTKEEKLFALEQNNVPCEYIEKEVTNMCNLSQGVLAQGRRQGEQSGDDRRLVSSVKALMETLGSFEHAVKALKLSTEEVERCKLLMSISV